MHYYYTSPSGKVRNYLNLWENTLHVALQLFVTIHFYYAHTSYNGNNITVNPVQMMCTMLYLT